MPLPGRSSARNSRNRQTGQSGTAQKTKMSRSQVDFRVSLADYENHGHAGVYILQGLEAYNRKRLIQQKGPFIVPGNQLYLPDLGIDKHLSILHFFPEYSKNVKPVSKCLKTGFMF